MPGTFYADSFREAVAGSTGTAVFGRGIDAVTGDVLAAGDDYLTIEADGRPGHGPQTYVVPIASVVYFRYADDD